MDTHVPDTPKNPQVGDDIKQEAGASYAHAVLNFKQTTINNNKENIKDVSVEPLSQEVPDSNKQMEPDTSKLNVDDDGTFTPVVSHSRKDRKNEKKKQRLMVNGTVEKLERSEKHENKKEHFHVPKQKEPVVKEKEKREEDNTSNKEIIEEKSDAKKVFVEAPIPKVNPWQVKQAAQSSVKENTTEKRVLQPKKQEVTVNGSSVATGVVKAPKDKRRYNHKVS